MGIKLSIICPVYNQEELVIRAIKSIPNREDIEVIVINDGSTDNTWNKLLDYRQSNENKFELIYLYNKTNKGVGYTVNKGIDNARGEYIVMLGSDDYFYTEELEKIINKYLNNCYDMVYFNLRRNDNSILEANKKTTRESIVGSVKFIKRSFIGDIRCPIDINCGEDAVMHFKLLEKNPKELFTNIVAKHYNYPRKGSLCWQKLEEIKKQQ